MTKQCIMCGKVIMSKRADAKFCSDSCRSKHNYQNRTNDRISKNEECQSTPAHPSSVYTSLDKDAFEKYIKQLNKANDYTSRIIIGYQEQLNKIGKQKEELIKSKANAIERTSKIIDLRAEIENLEKILDKKDEEIYNFHISEHRAELKLERYPIYSCYYKDIFIINIYNKLKAEIRQFRINYKNQIKQLNKQINHIKDEQSVQYGIHKNFEEASASLIEKEEQIKDRITVLENKLTSPLDQETQKALLASMQQIPTRSHKVIKQIKSDRKKGFTADEIRNLQTIPLELINSELSHFLGNIDRQSCAIALTGDSGAGKSFFSFDLAELFDQSGYKCMYYSLEEGIGELTKNKLDDKIFSKNMIVNDIGQLVDIRKSAKEFDIIFIDSFGKIGAKTEDYEKLRKDFPQTIFICIFQKTTTGTIRGGSSITFDSSAVIDVTKNGDERIATMTKSRYGTQGWKYSITDQCLIDD